MKNVSLILIVILLFNFSLFAQSKRSNFMYQWKNGSKYFGDWDSGKKHGEGVYIWSSGNKYEGELKDTKIWAGKIYDPETAQVYSSFMEVGRKGILKIRGYIGAPFFGRTQNLVPVSDCNEVVLLMLKANKNIPNNCIF